MTKHPTQSTSALWARFRFSVVGEYLSAGTGELRRPPSTRWPPRPGRHPVTGRDVRYAAKTIERWLYRAPSSRTIRWASCDGPCGRTVGR